MTQPILALFAAVAALTIAAQPAAADDTALKAAIAKARSELPLEERIKALQDRVAAKLGPADPTYDHKADMDDLWGV